MTAEYARLHVQRGQTHEFPIAQLVPNGWQSGAHHYPAGDVVDATPVHVLTDVELAEHDRQVAARALREWIADWPTTTNDGTFLATVAAAGLRRADDIAGGAS